jgi:hypothetical protein
MAQVIIQLIEEYDIASRLGYFVLDNAGSNDTCVHEILTTLRPDILPRDVPKRRLRCWGHILNLAAKSFLFGADAAAFEVEIATNAELGMLEAELQAWRKKGPVGKLHNKVVFIRRTPQRRELFLSFSDDLDMRELVLALDSSDEANTMLVQDNDTRWNSTYLMIDRALKKRREIEAFVRVSEMNTDAKKRVPEKDQLTDEEWRILAETHRILQPLFYSTKHLEGRGRTATHGSIWETLPSMEYILSHFENLKTQYAYDDYMQAEDVATDEMTVESRKHFREAINNAWRKLNDYYTLLDDSPVYTAALVLHPGHNWQYIEEKWGEARRTSWIRASKTSVKQFFDQGWKDRSSRPPTPEVTSLGLTNPNPHETLTRSLAFRAIPYACNLLQCGRRARRRVQGIHQIEASKDR